MKLEVVATLFTYFQASSSSIKLKHHAQALQVKVALRHNEVFCRIVSADLTTGHVVRSQQTVWYALRVAGGS